MSQRADTNKLPLRSGRRRARELAMQGIYQWRLAGGSQEQIIRQICDDKSAGRYDAEFFSELLQGALSQHHVLEQAVVPHLDRLLDELSPVEYAVLMLAAFELLHHLGTPYRVIINEAVELAKLYGGTDGYKYVNGVLDKLAAQVRAAELAAN